MKKRIPELFKKTTLGLVRRFISIIGDDCYRAGVLETPQRVTKMWAELYKGYDETKKPNLTVFNNNSDGVHYDQIIIDKGYFFSHCEHHLVPFFGFYSFGYIPDKKVVGLSKVARVVDWYSSRLQIQERLTKQIVDEFDSLLQPKGVILILKARHLCKEMRGVRKVNGEMITSEIRGVFKEDTSARQEFLQLIK